MTGARFSIGQALTAGLRLSVRHPLAVLVWGGVMMLFSLLAAAVVIPIILSMFAAMPLDSYDAEASEALMQSSLSFQLAINGLNLVQLVLSLVVWTAAMRATLRIGRPDKWFFMRLGMDELRVAVVMLAIFLGLYIGVLIIVLIGFAFGFALHAAGEFAVVIGVFVLVLAVLIGLLAIWSRLSLMPPASIITGQFAFVEGWRMGRGQTLRLMALNLAIWLVFMAVYVLVGIIVAAILIGGFFASGAVWPEDPQTPAEVLAALKPMIGWAVLAFVPLTLFAGWAISFTAGALTSAARQLADGALPPVAPTEARDGADASR